jgi:hypothetical protein
MPMGVMPRSGKAPLSSLGGSGARRGRIREQYERVAMALFMMTTAAMVFGFLAGLLTFRQKQQWCPICGSTLTCPSSAEHTHAEACP